MERSIVRVIAVVALVFLLAGDFASVFTPMLRLMGFTTDSTSSKTQPVRTSSAKFSGDSLDDDESQTIDILSEYQKFHKKKNLKF